MRIKWSNAHIVLHAATLHSEQLIGNVKITGTIAIFIIMSRHEVPLLCFFSLLRACLSCVLTHHKGRRNTQFMYSPRFLPQWLNEMLKRWEHHVEKLNFCQFIYPSRKQALKMNFSCSWYMSKLSLSVCK